MTNLVVNETSYVGGLFPKIPERMGGQDTLLVSAEGIVLKVDNFTTTKDIRKGNYNKVVRVSTLPFSLEIKTKAMSSNKPYEFDVKVGVECRIKDSVSYYTNRTTYNIEESITTTLSRIVKPIAKKFKLTDNEMIDEELFIALSDNDKQYSLESLGIVYKVHSADAEPDSKAEKYVKEMTDSELRVHIERHKVSEAEKLTARDIETAVMTKVASGQLDMQAAIEQLTAIKRKEGHSQLDDIERLAEVLRGLQEKNFMSDTDAKQRIGTVLGGVPNSGNPTQDTNAQLTEKIETENNAKTNEEDDIINELLKEEVTNK